jgi:hypothetical protein
LHFHPLEITNRSTELLSLPQVRHGLFKAALCDTNHLGPDPDSAFVEDAFIVWAEFMGKSSGRAHPRGVVVDHVHAGFNVCSFEVSRRGIQ